jgi:hypothetical protein
MMRFGGVCSLKLGGQFCVGAFESNVTSVAVIMLSHLISLTDVS